MMLGEFSSSIYTKLQPIKAKYSKRVIFLQKVTLLSKKGNVSVVK